MAVSIGIDLGTTFSSVAVLDEAERPVIVKNSEGEAITPSVIYFPETGEPVVGAAAKEEQALGETDVASFFKRSMGEAHFRLNIRGKDYTPEDLSTILLKKLKSDAEQSLGATISDCVITVPAYFNNFQREATVHAGQRAGLNVLRIINEPTSAALAYGVKRSTGEQTAMVYDLGGGTFDVTIVRISKETIEVIATDGDHELGGKDWDDRIATWVAQQFQDSYGVDPLEDSMAFNDLLVRCEDAKKQLSSRKRARITISHSGEKDAYEIDRGNFEEITRDLMERTQVLTTQVLEDANLNWSDLAGVLLVGGSTRMPMVQKYVEQMSGKPAMMGVNVDEAVALGAAIQAGMDNAPQGFGEGVFSIGGVKQTQDVMSHSLGMIAVNDDRSRYINSIIISKNKPIPSVETLPYQLRTTAKRSNEMEVYMLQGESDHPNQCIVLGKYTFSNVPHVSGGQAVVDVSYEYDRNGIVTVSAQERSSGKSLPMHIDPVPDDMSWVELPPEDEEEVAAHTAIVLTIDVSGSMSGSPLLEAQNAARSFVKKCDLSHMSIGLVGFGSSANQIVAPVQNSRQLNKAIDQLTIHGSTNMADGIRQSQGYLQNMDDPRFIILLTDGFPDNQSAATKAAASAKAEGIDIITIGTGGADTNYLKTLASSDENTVFAEAGNVVATFSRIAQVLTESHGGLVIDKDGISKKKSGLLRFFS